MTIEEILQARIYHLETLEIHNPGCYIIKELEYEAQEIKHLLSMLPEFIKELDSNNYINTPPTICDCL